MKNRIEGIRGESWAVGYLIEKGYRIIDTNKKLINIEVDIIAEDSDKTIVFIEVKTRNNLYFGHPFEAITKEKQNRYRKFAALYVSQNRLGGRDIRFDAIAMINNDIEHLVNAF
jgi:Predicted endonuclease distantly related to archaeal Holliday junction resolvase